MCVNFSASEVIAPFICELFIVDSIGIDLDTPHLIFNVVPSVYQGSMVELIWIYGGSELRRSDHGQLAWDHSFGPSRRLRARLKQTAGWYEEEGCNF